MHKHVWIVCSLLLGGALLITGCGAAQPGESLDVAVSPSFRPFIFMDESTNQLTGFDIDLMNAVASEMSLRADYTILSWDDIIDDLYDCTHQAYISALHVTERSSITSCATWWYYETGRFVRVCDTTQPAELSQGYFSSGLVILVAAESTDIRNVADLAGMRVGVRVSDLGDDEFLELFGGFPSMFESYDYVVQALLDGNLDAVVVAHSVAINKVIENEGALKVVGEPLTDEEYGIAVCGNYPDLLEEINSALAKLENDGTLDDLRRKWFFDGD